MKKETIIVFVILILVIVLDNITQKFTKDTMLDLTEELSQIREELVQNNEDDIKNKIENVIEKWDEKKQKMVIYIEHNELEKIEMYMIETKSYIETKEYAMAIQSIDTCNFVIEHIKEKYEFALKNIF